MKSIELSSARRTGLRLFRFRIGQKVRLSHHETGTVLDGQCELVQGRHYVTYVVQTDCGVAARFCEENLRPEDGSEPNQCVEIPIAD